MNTREQKQIDHEQLTAYYSSFKEERDRLTSGFRAGGGIGGFLKDKISDLRGVDSEVARQDKLQKVKQKIEEVILYIKKLAILILSFESLKRLWKEVKKLLMRFPSRLKKSTRCFRKTKWMILKRFSEIMHPLKLNTMKRFSCSPCY